MYKVHLSTLYTVLSGFKPIALWKLNDSHSQSHAKPLFHRTTDQISYRISPVVLWKSYSWKTLLVRAYTTQSNLPSTYSKDKDSSTDVHISLHVYQQEWHSID